MAGPCRAGDVLGLVEGDVVLIGEDLPAVAAELLDRMLGGGGELVTLVTGADAAADLGDDAGRPPRRPLAVSSAGVRRRPAALPAADRRGVKARPAAAAADRRRQDREGAGRGARPGDRRRPAAALPAPVRRARRAHRPARPGGRRAGHRRRPRCSKVNVRPMRQRAGRPARGRRSATARRSAHADVLQPGRGASATCDRPAGPVRRQGHRLQAARGSSTARTTSSSPSRAPRRPGSSWRSSPGR